MVTVDISEQIKELGATLTSIEKVLDLDAMREEITKLQEEVGAPDLWDDQINAQRVTGRLSTLQAELERITGLRQRLDDLEILVQLGQEEGDADAITEAETELGKLHAQIDSLEVRTLLSGEYDERDALMSIRSGAGGVDAADFAEMLQRMYIRWAERHQYGVEVYDVSYAEEAGIKSATFARSAPYAYGTLSVEAGTHRLVRISPFGAPGSRQTSFAAVEVIPVMEETDEIEIPDKEIRVDVFRSSGPGGQSVNTTDSAGAPHPHPHRRRGQLPEREEPAAEQGQRDGDPQGQAARAQEGRGAGPARRAARRRAGVVGRPDAQLRAQSVPDGQGPAHGARDRQHPGRARRRDRRLHRGRHPLAPGAGSLGVDLALAALLLATVTTGLAAGVFALYQHTVMPGLRSTDDRTFVAAFQALDRAIINPWFMLTAFFGALVFTGAATLLHLGEEARFSWILSAFVLYVVTVVITVAVNVPRNDTEIKAAGDPNQIDVAAAGASIRRSAVGSLEPGPGGRELGCVRSARLGAGRRRPSRLR